MNSHRAQLEIGYKRNLTKKTMIWGALIGEREFSGNTHNAIDFISVHGKGLKGNTVRGDLAVKYMSDSKVSADFKVSGSLGKMQGGVSRI